MSSQGGLEREVAVKLLRQDLEMADDAVRRLRDEGRMLARLDHPALLNVYDLVLLDGRVAMVTEFVDGDDLGDCFKAPGGMPTRALLQAMASAADALHAAWTAPGSKGRPLRLAHRDIKPSNLRVSRHGRLKVLDFGIARSDEMTREAKTGTDLIIGSPAYMAPERFLDADVRSASDVFALGCTLYEGLLGGRRLYAGVGAMVQSTLALDRDRYEAFMEEQRLPATVPESVVELVDECLRYAPEDRPTAAQLARRCEELADDIGGLSLRRWTREREWPTAAVVRGSLDGKVVTEGSLALSRQAPSPEPVRAASTRRRGVILAGLGTAAVAVATGILVVVAGGGLAAWQAGLLGSSDELTAGVPASIEHETPVPAPPNDEPQGELAAPAAERPAPAPDEPETELRVHRAEAVPVASPSPADSSSSRASPAVVVGLISRSGSHPSVALFRQGEVISLDSGPVSVAAGEWQVRSGSPDLHPLAPIDLSIAEGTEIRLHCSEEMQKCVIR